MSFHPQELWNCCIWCKLYWPNPKINVFYKMLTKLMLLCLQDMLLRLLIRWTVWRLANAAALRDARLQFRKCLISGNFAQMILYKSIGKSAFSGNLQPFQDFLTMLTGISDCSVFITTIFKNSRKILIQIMLTSIFHANLKC